MGLIEILIEQSETNRAVEARLTQLESRMALTDDALAELDNATNEVAADLDALRAQVETFDTNLAAQIGERADRLRQLASDPENPVPPAEPAQPVS